jgi:regulatory protein
MVYQSDLKRLKLVAGQDIPEAVLMKFRQDYLYQRAMNKALYSLKSSDKTIHELRKKLLDGYYDREITDTTIDKLIRLGYLDDERYAAGYIRRNISRKNISLIRYELLQKGIDDEIIDKAVSESDIPDEYEVVAAMLRKRYDPVKVESSRDKVIGYFLRKGYSYRVISKCVDSYLNEN